MSKIKYNIYGIIGSIRIRKSGKTIDTAKKRWDSNRLRTKNTPNSEYVYNTNLELVCRVLSLV